MPQPTHLGVSLRLTQYWIENQLYMWHIMELKQAGATGLEFPILSGKPQGLSNVGEKVEYCEKQVCTSI